MMPVVSALAEDEPPRPSIFQHWVVWLKAGHAAEFEEALKEFIGWRKAQGEGFSWYASTPRRWSGRISRTTCSGPALSTGRTWTDNPSGPRRWVLGGGAFVEAVQEEEKAGWGRSLRDVEEILAEVSRDGGVRAEEILGPSRARRISAARQEFYVRAHREAGQSMADLARLTGRT